MRKVGRNESCPCGSGKKYKNCHERMSSGRPQWVYLLLGGIIILAAIVIFFSRSEDLSTPRQKFLPQPGAAPPGKVWSPEHGHWHDAR